MKVKTGSYNIAPGAIRTPINKEALGSREALDELNKLILYNWIEEPSDIAAAVWSG
jgi:glucose 1-dehydrogenase